MDKVQIKRVFLDMDGVISDLDMDMINDWKKEGKWLENFLKFIDSDGFEKLKMIDGADMLLDYLLSSNIKLTILSSAGNPPTDYYKKIAYQKTKWLNEHGINVPTIIVQKKEDKQLYAGSDALLIDDTASNCQQFVDRGGHSILHISINYTLDILKHKFILRS
ncbi:MAG: hypothetical protein IM620_08865 [Cytophagales bacterium]|nr:hypothetical protein [Cytophagales bacterium]